MIIFITEIYKQIGKRKQKVTAIRVDSLVQESANKNLLYRSKSKIVFVFHEENQSNVAKTLKSISIKETFLIKINYANIKLERQKIFLNSD